MSLSLHPYVRWGMERLAENFAALEDGASDDLVALSEARVLAAGHTPSGDPMVRILGRSPLDEEEDARVEALIVSTLAWLGHREDPPPPTFWVRDKGAG